MHRHLRWGALLVALGSLTLAAPWTAGGAAAAPRSTAKAPAPPAGWVVDRIRIEPLDPASSAVSAPGIGEYRGVLDVVRSGAGLAVVNELGFEDYLKGISEVPVSWPIEAQKAQAIAARTYALSEVARKVNTAARAAGAHLCATDACQVYAGLAKERRPGAEAWVQAVEATRGHGLLYKGQPIVAKYSSSNGGRSVAGGYPYLRSVGDPDDRHSPLHRWTSQLPLDQVRAALGLGDPIVRAARSGDTVAVVVEQEDGAEAELTYPAADFRSRIVRAVAAPAGLPQSLPSGRFGVFADPANGVLVAQGEGWGHGLGMSQWGAYGKALRGMKAPDILAAYYAGLRPVPVDAPPSIRVAVALDQAAVSVTAGGRFRIVDGQGRTLARIATGVWRVEPAGAQMRLVPPRDQSAAPAVAVTSPPVSLRPGVPGELRFTVSAPAVVRVSIQPPTGPALQLAERSVEGGEVSQPLPPLPAPGAYVATITVDAGVHRQSASPVGFTVSEVRASAVPAAAVFAMPQPGPPLLAAALDPLGPASPLTTLVAAWLLLGAAAAALVAVRQVRQMGLAGRPPLH